MSLYFLSPCYAPFTQRLSIQIIHAGQRPENEFLRAPYFYISGKVASVSNDGSDSFSLNPEPYTMFYRGTRQFPLRILIPTTPRFKTGRKPLPTSDSFVFLSGHLTSVQLDDTTKTPTLFKIRMADITFLGRDTSVSASASNRAYLYKFCFITIVISNSDTTTPNSKTSPTGQKRKFKRGNNSTSSSPSKKHHSSPVPSSSPIASSSYTTLDSTNNCVRGPATNTRSSDRSSESAASSSTVKTT